MDSKIIGLFFDRSEQALSELSAAYGNLCRKIAYGILKNNEDTEECLNTSYMRLWDSIPPTKPDSLRAYLCSVVRNTAFSIYTKEKLHNCDESFEELSDVIADERTVECYSDGIQLASCINDFLSETDAKNRKIFMGRYYYNMSVAEIAHRLSISESAVKTRLSRLRQKLRSYLSERGVNV